MTVLRACLTNKQYRYVYKRPLILIRVTSRLFYMVQKQLLTTLIFDNFSFFQIFRVLPFFSQTQFPTTHMNSLRINPLKINIFHIESIHILYQIKGYFIPFSVIYNLSRFHLNSDNTMAVTAGTHLFLGLLSQSYSGRYTKIVRLGHMKNVKILKLLIIYYEDRNIAQKVSLQPKRIKMTSFSHIWGLRSQEANIYNNKMGFKCGP